MNGNATHAYDYGEFRKSSLSAEDGNACIEVAYRKSSYSSENGQECVELAGTLDAVRDSKNPAGPVLRVDLGSFLTEIKSGRLGR